MSQSRNSSSSVGKACVANRSSVSNGSLGRQVLCSSCGYSGLVHWDHGSVRVGDQAVERSRGDDGETTKNNLGRVSGTD